MGLLTLVTFLPAAGALLLLALGRGNERGVRATALLVTIATLFVAVPLVAGFEVNRPGFQLVERHGWIESLGISYKVGIDGLSLSLILLTLFLTPLAVLASWKAIGERVLEFHVALLLLESGMIGVFVALDLFLFYVFWEAMLIPMAILIGVWGGTNRRYAAIKFILYTLSGSLLMLLGIIYVAQGAGTFDFEAVRAHPTLDVRTQLLLFAAFALAFAVKVPMVPFHTWLPDAHVEAPTAGSVILAGVLLKMGAYGFLRFAMPLFPEATRLAAPLLACVSIVGIIYGALLAMAQEDIKKMVAYSSVSHLGFVMLGIFSLTAKGVSGGVFQMISHGLSTGALFLLVGIIYERRHTRRLDAFGGLAGVAPVFATVFVIISLSSIGLPGTNGFVGEFLILLGTFEARRIWAVVAAVGVVLGAVYMLRMVQKVLFGKPREEGHPFPDMTAREWVVMVPVTVSVVALGVFPGWLLRIIEPSVTSLLAQVGK